MSRDLDVSGASPDWPVYPSDIVRMGCVEPAPFGVVKIVWLDGFEAIVDLRPVIAVGDMFAFLRDAPERFRAVALDEFGHSIRWIDDEGDDVDFGSDALRRRAERKFSVSPVERHDGHRPGTI
jgi:hypothetical protein